MIGRRQQQGVALALLLWLVAALTLMVSGITWLSRTDVQLTSLQLDGVRAQAAATGIGHVLLRDMASAQASGEFSGRGIFARQYRLGGLELSARAIPVGGFVSINDAPKELLAELFRHAGGLEAGQAAALAGQVVQWRQGMPGADEAEAEGQGGAFHVIEDLLQVPGINRDLFDRISPAIHAQPGGQGGIDAAAAPPSVLLALAGGDSATVDFIEESRQDAAPGGSPVITGLNSPYLSESSGSAYCLEIDVNITDGRVFQQRIWVNAASGGSGLPWRYTRVMPVTVKPVRDEDQHAG